MQTDHVGRTALHEAAQSNSTSVVQILLDSSSNPAGGARLTAMTDDRECTALHYTTLRDCVGAAKLLVARGGSDVNHNSKVRHSPLLPDGGTALVWAARNNAGKVAAFLLDSGADVNATTAEGMTALHTASAHNNKDIVRLLLSRGANLALKDASGRTALDVAANNIIKAVLQQQQSQPQPKPSPLPRQRPPQPPPPPPPPSISSSAASNPKIQCRSFPFSELATATDHFSRVRFLGSGGFGKVHRGVLKSGTEVAVKSFESSRRGEDDKQFMAEIKTLAQFQHPHILQLMGVSTDGPALCLVYAFMSGGSLSSRLHTTSSKISSSSSSSSSLTWQHRLTISRDVADALAYLHVVAQKVHRDIKSDNILLDDNGVARVGDFGLVRDVRGMSSHTSHVIGTQGYMSPEYYRDGEVSHAMDVFAFGVVLLEILTGFAAFDPRLKPASLLSRVESELDAFIRNTSNNFTRYFAPEVSASASKGHLLKVTRIASLCVEPKPSSRPDMASVYLDLKEITKQSLSSSSSSPPPSSSPPAGKCVICMTEPATTAAVPCGHACMCRDDAARLLRESLPCPMCRAAVTRVMRVFPV